jgi:hypothetical protein
MTRESNGQACAFCLVLFVAGAAAVFAQTTGDIEGTVTDTSGTALPGVTVEAASPRMQGTRVEVSGRSHPGAPGPAALPGFGQGLFLK